MTRLARHAVPIAVGSLGVLLLGAIALTALLSPGTLGIAAARITEERSLDGGLSGLDTVDSDLDGLADSLENYVYGTNPQNWDTAGIGIPDGWLVEFGYDPLDPQTRQARGRPPPVEKLPPAYADNYPINYTPPLRVYYDYAKPTGYRPGVDPIWWRGGEHADPKEVDQTRTGIPTGWIIHHGLSLRNFDPSRVATGSAGNLTIREAWEHNTDPLEADSDRDGLDDWTEIHETKTDPSRFSTSGAGLADGWALFYGIDPFDANAAIADPDRDGLTNLEEFRISLDAFPAEVNASGIAAVYTRGLNPLEWQSHQTGIPDGWYVRYGLSPFGADLDRVIGRASDFPEYRLYAPEGFEPLDDIVFTVFGAYNYSRPSDWNESVRGVWWGGTNPVTLDTDGDGLPDPVEIRGWFANVTFGTGPEAKPQVVFVSSNPLEADSDGDGLTDLEEYRGRSPCGATTERTFPITNPRARDTASSGLSDMDKVCGVIRGEARYDLAARGSTAGLDPTRADSAGDYVRDGVRFDFWHERGSELKANPRYPYNGSAYRTVFEWTDEYTRFQSLTREQVLAQFRPDGDIDNDGLANVVDPDPSGGLYADAFAEPGTPRSRVFFLGGPQIDPAAYRFTEFASLIDHTASDPANPDTDGDGLPDAWEIRYGTFDASFGGWDLDPARQDSDGDGITDDKANNDGDVVTWYAYERRGANNERQTRTFVFDNRLEFLAGTDPNAVSTADDGVPDGWKAFWGSRITTTTYPSLVSARDGTLGSVALDRISEIESALASSSITPTAQLRQAGGKVTGYVRLVNVTSCSGDLSAILKPGERLADTNRCYTGRNLDNDQITVARALGVKPLTYADESRLRTNPYLDDTDGDGAPDAYEAYYRVVGAGGTAYPDPTVDERTRDPDNDGLDVADECAAAGGNRCGFESFSIDGKTYGAGADPNSADTDFDAIQDGIESGAGINPVDPSDVDSFASADVDRDSDGIPDFQELTGKDAKLVFGESIRTNANDPDTDGDGLLDGETRNLDPSRDAALVAAWKARGIAHDPQTNGTINFLGERSLGSSFGIRPDRLDSRNLGVPDGWLAYYNLDITRQVDASAYAASKPSWWVETIHGVWWWGLDPNAATTTRDRDGDGLLDDNGEDPFPGTHRLNRIVDGTLEITDPRDLEGWVKAAGSLANQRLRAQRVGEGAGDPDTARGLALSATDAATNARTRDLRACVQIILPTAPPVINKGEAFNVSGRVVLNERASGTCGAGGGPLLEGSEAARVGIANRTVIASVLTPTTARMIGAGWTDEDGNFNFSANVTNDQRYSIPARGLTLLSNVSGFTTTTFDAGQLLTGTFSGAERNRIVFWVYNTSATVAPGHPTHAPHLARITQRDGTVATHSVNATAFAVSEALPVTVRTNTRIEIDVAESAINGGQLVGDLRLLDAAGAPVTDRVVLLSWAGAPRPIELRNLTTDRNGRINVTNLGLPVGVEKADDYALTATFASADANLIGTNATLLIRVRDPADITAAADRAAATVGDTVSVSGEINTLPVVLSDGRRLDARPAAGASVRVALGAAEETVLTDDNGKFTARIRVPGSLSAGEQSIRILFIGSDDVAATESSLPLAIKRRADIVDLNRLEGPRSIEVTLRGRLIDNEGQGFEGTVEISGPNVFLARARSNAEGQFAVPVPLAPLELGSQQIRVVFLGDNGYSATENTTLARVTSATRLQIVDAPETLVRGNILSLRARLVDDENAPVVGEPVAIFWRGIRQEVRVTDATGYASFVIPTNITERPSRASLGGEFSPAANSVYQPATGTVDVAVVAGVTLELPDGSVPRGPVGFGGRILDDEGRPLPGSRIVLKLDGKPLGEARASRNGSFELLHVLADSTALGPHRLTAEFDGGSLHADVVTAATWHVRSPLIVEIRSLGPLIRGEKAPFEARIVDDRGAPVDLRLNLTLADTELPALTTSTGAIRTSLNLPATLPRGETTFRITTATSDLYDALDHTTPVVVKIRPKVELELPTLAVRGFALGGSVTLLDDTGQPLRNTSYAYSIGSGRNAVTGATDSTGAGRVAGVAPTQGDAKLELTVRGGPDVVAAQFTHADMRVVGPATPVGYAVLLIVVAIVVGVAAIAVAAVLLRRRQLQEARDIVEEAIRDLLAGNEYAGTIFLAYRRFTAHLARHGFVEKPSETPREFAVGVRKALPIGAVPLRALIGLFEEARYSDHAIGSRERDHAVASLASVRNELDTLLGRKKVTT